eukprot:CAMPEP_0183292482 /NCGR_PEP_ID=MMETSP0160_2-20130417/1522_1 /TAXON_ID=2839 ORGANISM="Odontella Sinensis, Strain Grunow 1884" /NCGR_SAMPLE_ID=MMETSP0160_2 /ASSEMBLY_ACC=CAM_ASM_000250 /LENGTH=227 /DNA_ID=CAMNT_0025453437 /DNA_START=150 /DNA_END=833 /DNA_ORIENTATION=-
MTSKDESSSSNSAKFWDKIADGYSKKPIGDEAAYQEKLRITQAYLRPHMEVLEYGCGTGGTALIHAPHVKHILATDVSRNMIDIARRRAAEGKVDNVTFKRASIEELDIPDNSKDAVLGLSILHLLDDREGSIRRTYRWLKPGGVFITSTPCVKDMGAMARMFARSASLFQYFGLLPTFYAFSRDELASCFKNSGFVIEHEWRPTDDKGKIKKDSAIFMVAKKPSSK